MKYIVFEGSQRQHVLLTLNSLQQLMFMYIILRSIMTFLNIRLSECRMSTYTWVLPNLVYT